MRKLLKINSPVAVRAGRDGAELSSTALSLPSGRRARYATAVRHGAFGVAPIFATVYLMFLFYVSRTSSPQTSTGRTGPLLSGFCTGTALTLIRLRWTSRVT
jgi:hypothetical protein